MRHAIDSGRLPRERDHNGVERIFDDIVDLESKVKPASGERRADALDHVRQAEQGRYRHPSGHHVDHALPSRAPLHEPPRPVERHRASDLTSPSACRTARAAAPPPDPRGSDRPGALRRRALLRTGRATFTASGSSNVRRVWQSKDLRSVHRDGRVARRSTHPDRGSRRLVCPLVGSCRCRLSVGSPDHVSALSRPGTRPGIRPVIHDDQLEGLVLLSWFPAAFPPPAFGLLVILSPPGSWAFLTVGLPAQWAGPRRGFRVSHARAAIGVGALSTPGTVVLILTAVALRPASAASQPLGP